MSGARHHWKWVFVFVWCLLGPPPLLAQEAPDLTQPLPETKETVKDLFGDEARLYFCLPNNVMVFVDTSRERCQGISLGYTERSDLLQAYMKACDKATRIQEGEEDPGFRLDFGETPVTFRAARRDNRSWVVLYVGPDDQAARFAVPQVWDLKDPRIQELIAIKSGFERLLIKSAL